MAETQKPELQSETQKAFKPRAGDEVSSEVEGRVASEVEAENELDRSGAKLGGVDSVARYGGRVDAIPSLLLDTT